MHQIATLEDSLRQERERKERALTEIDGLKDRLDKLGRDVVSSLHSKTTKVQKCEEKINLFPYTDEWQFPTSCDKTATMSSST